MPLLVLAELSWVLGGTWEKKQVLDTLEHILNTKGVTVESQSLVQQAIQGARGGGAGFVDRLIVGLSVDHGAVEVLTFDKVFARQPRVRRLH